MGKMKDKKRLILAVSAISIVTVALLSSVYAATQTYAPPLLKEDALSSESEISVCLQDDWGFRYYLTVYAGKYIEGHFIAPDGEIGPLSGVIRPGPALYWIDDYPEPEDEFIYITDLDVPTLTGTGGYSSVYPEEYTGPLNFSSCSTDLKIETTAVSSHK